MMLKSMGLEQIQFMSDPGLFKHVYVWSGVWQFTGYNAIIYIATLSSVDPTLHEAAIIDGAPSSAACGASTCPASSLPLWKSVFPLLYIRKSNRLLWLTQRVLL